MQRHHRSLVAQVLRQTRRLGSGAIAFAFTYLPPPVLRLLRRIPFADKGGGWLLDRFLENGRFVATRITAGPLRNMVLEVERRTQMGMIVGQYEEPIVGAVLANTPVGAL